MLRFYYDTSQNIFDRFCSKQEAIKTCKAPNTPNNQRYEQKYLLIPLPLN